MSMSGTDPRPGAGMSSVNLANCADEPIHLPGTIQPHGAMLVVTQAGELLSWSANAAALLALAAEPFLGQMLDQIGLGAEVCAKVQECIAEIEDGEAPAMMVECSIGNDNFDCIIHAHQGVVIIEYESRARSSEAVALFALKAHAAIERLKRQKSAVALLQTAVDQIRDITGFDRVMAYRFRHDDSGDVVAEAKADALPPFLGMRYPASDIPAQARRLYIINTLRLISDISYAPVPLLGRAGAAPLDMSFCVLRSVSPIHIEYLKNMRVGASMSISIVINGKLWGLIACHHMAARQVPYSIRMAADVIAQVLAASINSLESRERSALVEQGAEVRTRVMESLLHHDEIMTALSSHAAQITGSLGAGALIILYSGRRHVHGDVSDADALAIQSSLAEEDGNLVERSSRDEWPVDLQASCGKWVGMLAMKYDVAADGWLIALRPEQLEQVRWGGEPEKIVSPGPLGPRLTPRGSFDEWRQTVAGKAEPWEPARIVIARQLLAEMNRASAERHAQNEKTRAQLLAMLGHDLRNPLQTISMAASILERGEGQEMMGRRIKASSGRMARLISQVLDLSSISGGLPLAASSQRVDLATVVADVVDEFRTAKPGIDLWTEIPGATWIMGDADRVAQVVSNLISNANHHGMAHGKIDVLLRTGGEGIEIAVRNLGEEIDPQTAKSLYDPFKRISVNNARNKGGMGLGLHIANQIMAEHGGSIAYHYAAPHVHFVLRFPPAVEA